MECKYTKQELEKEGIEVLSQVPLMSITQYIEVASDKGDAHQNSSWSVYWVKRSDLERLKTRALMNR